VALFDRQSLGCGVPVITPPAAPPERCPTCSGMGRELYESAGVTCGVTVSAPTVPAPDRGRRRRMLIDNAY